MRYKLDRPLAIAMWDFSWLERRWPGAGYEDWRQIIDELKERGYDAVRIDAYPHLIAADGHGEWTLLPRWNQVAWGAPSLIKLTDIAGNLLEFMSICKEKGVLVALSTWFRTDANHTELQIKTPEDLATIWQKTIRTVQEAGLLDTVLYVDLCNEYPAKPWTPFLYQSTGLSEIKRSAEVSTRWMEQSLERLRSHYPDLNYTFSVDREFDELELQEVSFLDFLEPHVWMTQFTDFYQQVGYNFEAFEPTGFDNLVRHGQALYDSKPEYWQEKLCEGIDRIAEWSVRTGKPLITTECWGLVDYKDWPMLDWKIIKELCELGVRRAVSKGVWVGIATSNFCGPQFAGMWRDAGWHRQLTDLIHGGSLPVNMLNN